ncbi:MAG: mismatch-specific DNA-glycosylase [Dehalococcoidia bacterium]
MRTLPDLLRPGLDLVFVGINPGEVSARRRHYYAHPGNGFWTALSASRLVQEKLGPEDDRALLSRHGIGFTDLVKRVVTDSSAVTDAELRAALPAFRARIAYARPRAVCFTTTRGFHACFPGVRAASEWGRQPVALAGAEVWVMPSTSGRAVAHRAHVHRVLDDVAQRLSALRENIDP